MRDWLSAWPDLANVDVAFLPFGSLEQHGLHLPIGTDGLIANALALGLAARYEQSILLPLVPFSSSFEHVAFPGCVSLKTTTLAAVVDDILSSLKRYGIKCVIVNGHQGNHLFRNLSQEHNAGGHSQVLVVPSKHHWQEAYQAAGLSSSPSADMHAGEAETSIVMHLFPDAVRPDITDVDAPRRPLLEVLGMRAYTQTGAIGFPSQASAQKGAVLLQALTDAVAATVKEFLYAT
jgi:creatinine amidohydrolase